MKGKIAVSFTECITLLCLIIVLSFRFRMLVGHYKKKVDFPGGVWPKQLQIQVNPDICRSFPEKSLPFSPAQGYVNKSDTFGWWGLPRRMKRYLHCLHPTLVLVFWVLCCILFCFHLQGAVGVMVKTVAGRNRSLPLQDRGHGQNHPLILLPCLPPFLPRFH